MILYKYLSPDRIDVLESGMIRFTQPAAFSDPFESRPHLVRLPTVEDLEAEIAIVQKSSGVPEGRLLKTEHMERIADSMLGAFLRILSTSIGILSLTEVRDSLLMWAHYASKHQGFVIGFRTDHPYFQRSDAPPHAAGQLRKVEYSEARSSRPAKELTHHELYFTKSPEWAYEREWRQYRVLDEASRKVDSQPHPFCLFSFPHNTVESITVGCRATSETLARLKSLVCGDRRYGDARLLMASIDDHAFRLNFSEV